MRREGGREEGGLSYVETAELDGSGGGREGGREGGFSYIEAALCHSMTNQVEKVVHVDILSVDYSLYIWMYIQTQS